MFTPHRRSALRDGLVARARRDPRVSAAALVGSAAAGTEDDWSDIDLALRLGPDAHAAAVSADWTAHLVGEHGAVDTLDVRFEDTLYRVFLLPDTLQVDLSFWPHADFRATEPTFRLLFGEANPPTPPRAPDRDHAVGMAWLYALHARSALARGRTWQADTMVAGLREQTIALACLAHGLPPHQGRGVDRLPGEVLRRLLAGRPASLEPGELHRAFAAAVEAYLEHVRAVDAARADALTPVAHELVASALPDPRP